MLCLRIDLDYVPWDDYNANLYGHGEPAMILKLIVLARETGVKYHFFASNRSLRTFPTLIDGIIGEGHDLDWLSHFPDDPEEFTEARQLFALGGHRIAGFAYAKAWDFQGEMPWHSELKFLTALDGNDAISRVGFIPDSFVPISAVDTGTLIFFRETLRLDSEPTVAELAVRSRGLGADGEGVSTAVARPQMLAKHDPTLKRFNEFVRGNAASVITLREAIKESGS